MAGALPIDHLPPVFRTLAIFGWNLGVLLFIGLVANRVQVRRWPTGFVVVQVLWAMYGLTLGTNSFAAPLPARPAPSLALLVQRAGIWELSAYTLAAIATASLGRVRQHSYLSGPAEKLTPSAIPARSAAAAGPVGHPAAGRRRARGDHLVRRRRV